MPLRAGLPGERTLALSIEARRRLAAAGGDRPRECSGRVWINGREVGGAEPRYRHLLRSYD